MKTIQRPTIYDIAKLCGASASTVSAALNGSWKKRRIKKDTVLKIKSIAAKNGYSINMQARGLRKAKSGLVGMILPSHNNRFFSSLSQQFALEVRNRGHCPVIVSTNRDADEEVLATETLLSYAVDSLFIVGSTTPAQINNICCEAKLPHVFLDQPCETAPSVVSDNFSGAKLLTDKIFETMQTTNDSARDRIYFIGGDASQYATARRISGFTNSVKTHCSAASDDQIIACGYEPAKAADALANLVDKLGGLPSGLLINSIPSFEGVLNYFAQQDFYLLKNTTIGFYDYDPFASFLHFPIHMVRQNSYELIEKAFFLIDSQASGQILEMIEPNLIPPRSTFERSPSELA